MPQGELPVPIFFRHVHKHTNATDRLSLLSACTGYPRSAGDSDHLDESRRPIALTKPLRLIVNPLGRP